MPNLLHVHVNAALRQLLELGLDIVHALAATTDNDSRFCGMKSYLHLAARAVDLDAGDCRVCKFLFDVLANLMVLIKGLSITLVQVPLAFPVSDNADSKTDRMD